MLVDDGGEQRPRRVEVAASMAPLPGALPALEELAKHLVHELSALLHGQARAIVGLLLERSTSAAKYLNGHWR